MAHTAEPAANRLHFWQHQAWQAQMVRGAYSDSAKERCLAIVAA